MAQLTEGSTVDGSTILTTNFQASALQDLIDDAISQASAPDAPEEGDTWDDTTNDKLMIYRNTTWEEVIISAWRGIQDNLTSTATTDSLSAKQGKELKTLVDGKASSSHTHNYTPNTRGTVTGINNTGWTTAFKVDGQGLGSTIRFSAVGTANSVVVSNIVDIIANHHKDILITSQSGSYTRLYVKVTTNNSEDFVVQLKTNHATAVNLDIDVQSLNRETVTFVSSHSYTGQALEHDCKSHGFASSSVGGSAHEFYSNGSKLVASNDNQALADVDALSISDYSITLTKGDGTTETVTVPDSNNYTHPTGDGDGHVPLTGTTNDGKVLKAGETAGTYSWENEYSYTLPTASDTALGGIKVGTNLSVDANGVLSSTDTDTVYSHPTDEGNKHIPSGGTVGQVLTNTASGTGTWQDAGGGGASDINGLSDGYYGGYSLGLGLGALSSDDGTNNFNTAVGNASLYYNYSGDYNTAVGNGSLGENTTGASNTATGFYSLLCNTTGSRNTASGFESLFYNTTGSWNTASGYKSLFNSGKTVTAGSFVVGVAYTIQSVGTTNFTAIGASANTVGVVFTATGVGSGTGTASSNTNNNTALGYQAGYNITTGSSNIIIGSGVDAPSATGDNQLNIGNTIYGDTSTGNVEINGSIKIGDDTRAAATAGAGTLRWNSDTVQVSDGTDWNSLDKRLLSLLGEHVRWNTPHRYHDHDTLVFYEEQALADLAVSIGSQAVNTSSDFPELDTLVAEMVGDIQRGDIDADGDFSSSDMIDVLRFAQRLLIDEGSSSHIGQYLIDAMVADPVTYATWHSTGYLKTSGGALSGDITVPDTASMGFVGNTFSSSDVTAWNAAASGGGGGGGGASDINGLSDGYYGGYSLGLGTGALSSDDGTSNYNTAVGCYSLQSNYSGSYNTASGSYSLQDNTGSRNTASGYGSLRSNTSGSSNTASGQASSYNNITGKYNVSIGNNSLYTNTTGNYNTASGRSSLYTNDTGDYNTANGYKSLYDVTTGANNAGLGYQAGRSTSPSGEITDGSNIICLGDNSITALYCADTSISSSDGRDKTDVEDFTAGLDFITQMRPVTYRWDKRTDYLDDDNTDPLSITPDGTHKKPKQHIGFISQEVQALEQALGFATDKDNELICNTNEDATAMGLKYERLVPVLVNAIKELSAENKALLARIEALETPTA